MATFSFFIWLHYIFNFSFSSFSAMSMDSENNIFLPQSTNVSQNLVPYLTLQWEERCNIGSVAKNQIALQCQGPKLTVVPSYHLPPQARLTVHAFFLTHKPLQNHTDIFQACEFFKYWTHCNVKGNVSFLMGLKFQTSRYFLFSEKCIVKAHLTHIRVLSTLVGHDAVFYR